MKVKEWVPRDIRSTVFQRDNHGCCYCASVEQLTIDHIYPESEGGEIDIRNLATCCAQCNVTKGTMLVQDFINLPRLVQARVSFTPEHYERLGARLRDSGDYHRAKAVSLAEECEERLGVYPLAAIGGAA